MGNKPSKSSNKSRLKQPLLGSIQSDSRSLSSYLSTNQEGQTPAELKGSAIATAQLPPAKLLARAQKAFRLATSTEITKLPGLQRIAYQNSVTYFEGFFATPDAVTHSDSAQLKQQFKQAKAGLQQAIADDSDSDKETEQTERKRNKKSKTAQQPSSAQGVETTASAVPLEESQAPEPAVEAASEGVREEVLEIFRYPTPVPEADFIDIDRPLRHTQDLAAVLWQLPNGSPRRAALSLLAFEVVDQFGARLVRTPALLSELVALGTLPDEQLLHKILQQFTNCLKQEAALDLDLVEGLAVLLETAHPQALRANLPDAKQASADKDKVDEKEQEAPSPVTKELKLLADKKEGPLSLAVQAKQMTTQVVSLGLRAAESALESDPYEALTVAGKKAVTATLSGFISLRQAVARLSQTEAETTAMPAKATTVSVSADISMPAKAPPARASRYNNIQYLLILLNELTQRYKNFHRQAQTEAQEVDILRAIARVLDALRDIGINGISKDSVRKEVYEVLQNRANQSKAAPVISLWANYALQALVRLEDDGSAMGEWLQRGKKVVKMVGKLKQFWGSWDISHLSEAYQNAKDAFHVDHQPEAWYEALWYCQLLIRSYEFQTLESYLYGQQPCPQRYAPPFQLGLLLTLDGVIRDTHSTEQVKAGCLQLVQKMFVDHQHWYCQVEEESHAAVDKLKRFVEAGKKTLLYTGRAYQLEAAAVQSGILDQLMGYLSQPTLYDSVQPLLLALRDPTLTLTSTQNQLLNRHAPLHKILPGSQKTAEKPAPSVVLWTAAQGVVQQHLAWKLEALRIRALGDENTQRMLEAYVPPKGLVRLRPTEEPDPSKQQAFDLLQSSLAFLGLTSRDPAKDAEKAMPKPEQDSRERKRAASETDEKQGPEKKEGQEDKAVRGRRASLAASDWDLAQCVVDIRPVPGQVDQRQLMLWRQTYASQFTRFLLLLTQMQQAPDERRWYFCGQTGEGEWYEGELPVLSDKDQEKAQEAKEIFFQTLALQLEPYRQAADGLTSLQEDAEFSVLKRTFIQELNHIVVMNGSQKAVVAEHATNPLVLLLTAGAGSGKSTYGRYLEKYLWQHYAIGGYIPVFIDLTQLPNPEKPFLEEHFKQLGISPADLAQLKDPSNGYRFLFIFDGYDELISMKSQNLFTINQLQHWPCKVIIGCRSEALQGNYLEWFSPQRQHQQHREGLIERWVAPFDDSQIQNYLKKYVRQQLDSKEKTGEEWQGWKDADQYWQQIQAMGSIRQMVARPFMLTILVEVLPAMIKERQETQTGTLNQTTRLDLYEKFIHQWFQKKKSKLSAADLQEAKRYGEARFRFHEGAPPEEDYKEFCENFAAYLFKNNQVTVNYQPRWEMAEMGSMRVAQPLDRFFKISDPAAHIVLRGTPILVQGKNRGFLHKSILEFFIACRIFQELSRFPLPWEKKPASAMELKHFGQSRSPKEGVRVWKGIGHLSVGLKRLSRRLAERQAAQTDVVRMQEKDPLKLLISQRLLNAEPSILQFLADYVARDERFQKTLLYWVLASRTQPALQIASANALTILNVARFSFSGMNLSGIRVRGADLSQAILDHTDLSGADLRDVNFNHAFLRGTKFLGSQLLGAFFESTSGQEIITGQVGNEMFSPDYSLALFIDQSGEEVRIYDTQARQFSPPLIVPAAERISEVTFTADNQVAFLHSRYVYGQIFVYDVSTRKLLELLQVPEVGEINSVTVTPDSRLAFLYNSHGSKRALVYDISMQKLLKPQQAPESVMIDRVTITPDSSLAFLYHWKGSEQVLVYDVSAQNLLEPLQAPEGDTINHITITQDGRLAFLYNSNYDGGGNRQVLVYDISTQKLLQPLQAPEGETIHSITVTPDSRLAFLYHRKGSEQVLVYDISTQKLLQPLQAPEGETINSITVTPDSRLAFLYYWKGSEQVLVYDVSTQNLLEPLQAPEGDTINHITITQDSRLAFLYNSNYDGGGNRQVLVYDISTQKLLQPLQAPEGETIHSITVTPDSRLAFLYHSVGSRQVMLYDCQVKRELPPLQFDEPIYGVRIFKNQSYCVFFAHYHCYIINIIDPIGHEPFLLPQKMKERILDVHLLDNEDLLIECENSRHYQAMRWKIKEPTKTPLMQADVGHSARIQDGIRLSLNLVLSKSDQETHVWQVQRSKLFLIHSEPYRLHVDVTPNSRLAFLYHWNSSERALVYDISAQKMLEPLQAPEGHTIHGVTITPNNRLVFLNNYSKGGSRQVLVYDVSAQKLLESLQTPEGGGINRVTVTPDGHLAFLYNHCDGSGQVLVYDVSTQKPLKLLQAPKGKKINSVTITPDNRLAFLQAGDGRQILVYDVSVQKWLESLQAPEGGEISSVTVTPDSRLAFLHGKGQQIFVYDVSAQKLLERLQASEGSKISNVTVTPDSSLAFLHGKGQQILVYDVSAQKLLESLQAPEGGEISSVTITPDSRLAFLYDRYGSQEVLVYDVSAQKPLEPLQAPEGSEICSVTVTPDSRLAFLQGEDQLLFSFSCEQRSKVPLNFAPLNVHSFHELLPFDKISEVKTTHQPAMPVEASRAPVQCIALYGKGGCYLWLTQSQKIVPVLKDVEIRVVECFWGDSKQLGVKNSGDPLRLLTGGSDGTLRLWDISNLDRPLLKFCTRGLTFHAQDVELDGRTSLSEDNQRVLQTRGAKMIGASPSPELSSARDARSISSLSSSSAFLRGKLSDDAKAKNSLEEKRRAATVSDVTTATSVVSPAAGGLPASPAQTIGGIGLIPKPKTPPPAETAEGLLSSLPAQR